MEMYKSHVYVNFSVPFPSYPSVSLTKVEVEIVLKWFKLVSVCLFSPHIES